MEKDTRIVVTGLTAVVTAAISALSAYLIPHIPLVWQISLGVSIAALITYLVLDFAFFKALFSKKTARYGLNAVVMAVIGLFIVVFINMIANEYDLKWDVSKNKINTLSEESIKVMQNLNQDITMKAFLQPNQVQAFEKIYEKYAYHSSHFKKEYIDVDQNPMLAQQYNIKQAGTLVFESDTRTSRVDNLRGLDDPKLEEKITNAIIHVAKGSKKKIYFLSGHGEHSLSDGGRDGYSQIKETLSSGRYDVEELMMVEKDAIPADTDILVVAGPKSEVFPHEIKAIESYLSKGGKALFLIDPEGTPSIRPLLAKFGADWEPKKVIFETNQLQQYAGGSPLAPVVVRYDKGHELTRDANGLSVFPVAAPVEKAKELPKGYRATSLFSSSSRSSLTELAGNKVDMPKPTARKGPISMALALAGTTEEARKAAEAKEKETGKKEEHADHDHGSDHEEEIAKAAASGKDEFRAVVVGDSDFASNGVLEAGINSDLFQNMLSWLALEEDLIAIRPKDADSSELEITEARMRIINLASIVIMPLIMLFSAVTVWVSRRRR